VTGPGPLTYQWQKNGTNLLDGPTLSGATTSHLTLTSITPSDSASYQLIISSSSGSVTSLLATLTVVAPPQIVSAALLPGMIFKASLLGTPGLNYRIDASTNLIDWMTITNVIERTDGPTFTDPSAASHQQRFYRATWSQ